MRAPLSLLFLTLVACGGDKDGDDSGAECGPIGVDVTVIDTFGEPVEEADVNIDNSIECTAGAAGEYACSVPAPGDYNLYVTKPPEFAPWGSRITTDCTANPLAMTVTLNIENGGL